MDESAKKTAINAIDRRKYPMDKNLRLASILILIVVIIGLFQPLLGVKASATIKSGDSLGVEVPIVKDDNSIVEFSSTDFIFHKDLRDCVILGQKIGDVEILGIKVYDFLKSPFPDLTVLTKANEFLNSDALSFLTNPDLLDFCEKYLGDIGQGVVSLCKAITDISAQAKDVLGQVSTVMGDLKSASDTLNDGITAVEGYKTFADNILLVWAVLIILCVVLFLIDKGPRFLPAIILSIFSFISLGIGIGVAVVNSMVSGELDALVQSLNATVQDSLASLIPNASDIVSTVFPVSGLKIVAGVNIYCGIGWWIVTIGLLACTAIAYIAPIAKKHRLATKVSENNPEDTTTGETQQA